jgi:hypothetical protein
MGLKSPIVQDSLAGFMMGNTEGLDGLSKALGMKPDALGLAVKLFGDINSELMIEVVGQVMDLLGANTKIKNLGKALAAFVSKHQGKFKIDPESKTDTRKMASATTILGDCFRIPTIILDGVIAAVN